VIPGKKYAPEDIVAIAWGRRWFIAVPFVLATAAAIGYAMAQPNRYKAQTAIIITPQQVPTNYVQSTVTTLLADRLQMISQQILSRTRLERIIEEFNLYPEMRASRIMEDVIEQMRRDIAVQIQPNRDRRADSGAFTVGFEADNPRTALLVTERLASLFIQENLVDRAGLADATSQFLDAQLEEARRRLIDHEQKLQDYRQRNAGSLPTQIQSNLQGIQTTQMQLQASQEETNRDRDRRLFLERALQDAETNVAEAAVPAPVIRNPDGGAPQPASAAARLEAARAAFRNLEQRLKPEHPDMQRARRMILDLEKEAEAEALGRPVSDGVPAVATPGLSLAERNRQSRIAAIKAEIENIDRRLNARLTEEQKLRSNLTIYQARVDAAPSRESELVELMRDYDILKTTYNELLRKSENSRLAVNLERRQIGEQFKIVDGARLPERPVSPDRPRLIGMGAVIGLGLGLALVGLLEYRDSTLKTDNDVVVALALPVLALIPAMVTKAEEKQRIRRRRLIALSSVAALMVVVGAAAWKFQLFERWVG
jgi:polysaccharide chain length determinant protein (PEP-CTERM system associated)